MGEMKSFLIKPELIKAFVSGQKTQTRRLIEGADVDEKLFDKPDITKYLIETQAAYKKNEIVYIREGFRFSKDVDSCKPSEVLGANVEFRLGGTLDLVSQRTDLKLEDPGKWRSPLHLPVRFARYFAKVTEVKVERIRNINDDDCIAEGIEKILEGPFGFLYKVYATKADHMAATNSPYASFKSLWKLIYGKIKWDENPRVFAYTFVKCDKNGKEIKA